MRTQSQKSVYSGYIIFRLCGAAVMMCAVVFITTGRSEPSGHCLEAIEYGCADGVPLVLDACIPAGAGVSPAVILVHGGGWSGGNRHDMAFWFEPLSRAGLAGFSISYRLAPTHRWPACIEDVKTAVRWVRANASAYAVDPNRIALMGYSAGGHLATFAAVTAAPVERVQAVVGLAAPTDLEADSERRGGLSASLQNLFDRSESLDEQARALLRRCSPMYHLNHELPPFLLVHGTNDASVAYSQSVNFQTALKAYDVPCVLRTLDGAGHRIAEWETYDPNYLPKTIRWLSDALATDHPAGTEPSDKARQ